MDPPSSRAGKKRTKRGDRAKDAAAQDDLPVAPEHASGPGPASPCTPQAQAEVDFGGSDHESFVEVAPDVRQELCARLSDEEVAEGQRRKDTVEVRDALGDLPEFLRVVHGEGMPLSDRLQKVKAMKARGVVHVRWRCVDAPPRHRQPRDDGQDAPPRPPTGLRQLRECDAYTKHLGHVLG